MYEHLLTGGTGFVGSHLLASLLADETQGHVYAFARGSKDETATDRVQAAVDLAGFGDAVRRSERLSVVDFELTEPTCAVDVAAIPPNGGPRIFWHLAASLQWRAGARKSVFKTNLDGTQNALDLAKQLGADLFVYVSTAYTCGRQGGEIPEQLHEPEGFSNVYEESKAAAEQLVANTDGMRTLILRPSVVVGTSQNYEASGSYTGLYGYLKELRKFSRMLGDSDETARISGVGSTRISFIPVDHVVEDARRAVEKELQRPDKSVYHLTGDSESSMGDILDYMLGLLGIEGRLWFVDGEIEQPSTLERLMARRMEFFAEYTNREKRFVRSLERDRVVPFSELRKFIDSEQKVLE